jgi:hypothetical protein
MVLGPGFLGCAKLGIKGGEVALASSDVHVKSFKYNCGGTEVNLWPMERNFAIELVLHWQRGKRNATVPGVAGSVPGYHQLLRGKQVVQLWRTTMSEMIVNLSS